MMTSTSEQLAAPAAQDGMDRAKARRAERDASGELYVDHSIFVGIEACLTRNGKTVAHVVKYADAVEIAAKCAGTFPLCNSGEGAAGCKTCGGSRSINYAKSTCQPAHQGPCPSCVGVTIATFPVVAPPDATQTREVLQSAWDGVDSLPPLEFSEDESRDFFAALNDRGGA